MYLRTSSRRNRDGSTVRYLPIAHNERSPGGPSVAKVLLPLGGEDRLDVDALRRLIGSINRYLGEDTGAQVGAAPGGRWSAPFPSRCSCNHWWCSGTRARRSGRGHRRRRPVAHPQDRTQLRRHAHRAAPHYHRGPVFPTPAATPTDDEIRAVMATWAAAEPSLAV